MEKFTSINNTTVVVQNKSSLLPKIIYTNTQTLQLPTKNIKTEIIYKKIISCKTWVEISESFNLKGVERKSKKREGKGAD